jgi:hypothetical protein
MAQISIKVRVIVAGSGVATTTWGEINRSTLSATAVAVAARGPIKAAARAVAITRKT